jgi:hypothetical protein
MDWYKIGRRFLFLLFVLMGYGLLTDNLYLTGACIFVTLSLNFYMLLHSTRDMKKARCAFELAHEELINNLKAYTEAKIEENEKRKIVIK